MNVLEGDGTPITAADVNERVTEIRKALDSMGIDHDLTSDIALVVMGMHSMLKNAHKDRREIEEMVRSLLDNVFAPTSAAGQAKAIPASGRMN